MKCAVYIRILTPYQSKKKSIKIQKEFFNNFINNKNWSIYDFYIDIESLNNPNENKNFKNMISDIRKNNIDIVLMKELSILSNNTNINSLLHRMINNTNVDIIKFDNELDNLWGNKERTLKYKNLFELLAKKEHDRIVNMLKIPPITKTKNHNPKNKNSKGGCIV